MKNTLTTEEIELVAKLVNREIEEIKMIKDIYNLKSTDVNEKINALIKLAEKL